jgi:hypothetical protein
VAGKGDIDKHLYLLRSAHVATRHHECSCSQVIHENIDHGCVHPSARVQAYAHKGARHQNQKIRIVAQTRTSTHLKPHVRCEDLGPSTIQSQLAAETRSQELPVWLTARRPWRTEPQPANRAAAGYNCVYIFSRGCIKANTQIHVSVFRSQCECAGAMRGCAWLFGRSGWKFVHNKR